MRIVAVLLLWPVALAYVGGCGGAKKRAERDRRAGARATAAAAAGLVRHEFVMPALGEDFRVIAYCADGDTARLAERVAFARLAELEQVFDESRPDSEVSQLHANAGLGTVRVSDELYFLLRQGLRLGERSDGAVDVTAGAYAALWRAASADGRTPTDQELADADPLVDPEKLRLDPIGRTAHLTVRGMRLDLSALARGYVCDQVLGALARAGFPSSMVDGGRRIAVGHAPPGTKGWRIAITNAPPRRGKGKRRRVVQLARRAIASSGPVGDHLAIGGQPYARLMDPRTAIGARELGAATVVARRCWQAEALARAAAVLGEARGRELVRSFRDAEVAFHHPPGVPNTPGPEPDLIDQPEDRTDLTTAPASADDPRTGRNPAELDGYGPRSEHAPASSLPLP